MKIEKRDIVKCVILSIVTCGIYGIIWIIKLAKDAVSVKDENDSATVETILMLFFPFIGFYLCEKKFSEGCAQKGIPHNDNSILYLVLGLVGLGIVDYCLMQSDLNKLVDAGYAFDPTTAPQNPQYGPVQNPPYGAAQNPQNGPVQNPPYGAAQNPQNGPVQNPPYGAPQNPPYGAPQNPPYGAPQNPQYGPGQNPPYNNNNQQN